VKCELCCDSGRFPCVDQLKMLAALVANRRSPTMGEIVTDAPCPRCAEQELRDYLAGRQAREGWVTRPITEFGIVTMDGITAAMPLVPGAFPVLGNA
jgi:hypothetical protein